MGAKRNRYLVLTAFVAILTVALVACGGGEEKTSKETPDTGGLAPPDQQVLIAQSAEPEFFDPHRSNFEQDIAIERMLFRGLYQLVLDDDDNVVAEPAMADGEPEINGNVYTIKLKDGLTWSDGEPLTANDFEYSIKRECSPDVAGPYQYVLGAGMLDLVGCDAYLNGEGTADDVGIKAIDDLTLEITIKAPKPTFTTIMSLWATFPVRQDVVEEFGDRWTEPGNIVVNGPYTLTEFVAKDHVTLAPNPNWALEPKPAVQEITVKFIDDLEVAFRAFQTGELDMTSIPATEIPTIKSDPTLNSQFLQIGSLRIWSVEMQLSDPVLKDENVRLALSRAIDRESMVKVVYNDAYLPATYWLVEGIPGHQGNSAFEDKIGYDPEAAKQALADAGYPDGEGFPTLTITVTDRPDRKAEGEFLQQAWKETLGINTEIQAVDAKTRSSTFNSMNFDLFPGGWQNDYPDPENSLIGLFDTGGGNNMYECSDPDIDAKLEAAGSETDNEKRIQYLEEAETLIVTRLCGAAPIWQGAQLYLAIPTIGGIRATGALDAGLPGNWCPECWCIKAE
ncbi:MAG TPA: peptide ABC transporter substrate-binding protein [Dehalococcoidia bacterium]|nr:peptide ABC transporter substrate-binding protein [Dehalococcoidia bacterium]